jgi:aspartate aminotransferase
MTTRTLGFVNAPILGQKLVGQLLNEQVDVSIYARRRAVMARVLSDAGITFTEPRGAFYFFPEAPGGDDLAFVNALFEQNILAVPGRGFGCPGFFRLTFCVNEQTIERAANGFKRAVEKIKG